MCVRGCVCPQVCVCVCAKVTSVINVVWLADDEGSDTKTSTVATVQHTTGKRANCMAPSSWL